MKHWIDIESEKDLPKESGFFWIYEGEIIDKPCFFNAFTKKWHIECEQYPTRYQIIKKPEL